MDFQPNKTTLFDPKEWIINVSKTENEPKPYLPIWASLEWFRCVNPECGFQVERVTSSGIDVSVHAKVYADRNKDEYPVGEGFASRRNIVDGMLQPDYVQEAVMVAIGFALKQAGYGTPIGSEVFYQQTGEMFIPHVARDVKSDGFDPLNHIININADSNSAPAPYMPKQISLEWFRMKYPKSRVEVQNIIITPNGAMMKASLYAKPDDKRPVSESIAARIYNDHGNRNPDYIQSAIAVATRHALQVAGFGTPVNAVISENTGYIEEFAEEVEESKVIAVGVSGPAPGTMQERTMLQTILEERDQPYEEDPCVKGYADFGANPIAILPEYMRPECKEERTDAEVADADASPKKAEPEKKEKKEKQISPQEKSKRRSLLKVKLTLGIYKGRTIGDLLLLPNRKEVLAWYINNTAADIPEHEAAEIVYNQLLEEIEE